MNKLIFFIFITLQVLYSIAEEPKNCSTFMLKTDSDLFVGHNLDESPELHIPGIICINKRNTYREEITWYELIADPADYEKSLIPFEEKPEPKLNWISKYGSITFNSEGVDFPDGGINEKGLAIFEMSLGNTKYKFDKSNPTLFMVLWIQYVLDNCSNLVEVFQSTNEINLQGWSWHFFVTDKNGNCAIIEFLEGEAVIHQQEKLQYPVLCNTQYSKELDRLNDYQESPTLYKLLGYIKKPPRFVRAVNLLDNFDNAIHSSTLDYALKILDEIKVNGWNKWGIVLDVKNMKIYFHTNKNRKLRYLSFNDFDFTNENPEKILDIHSDLSGNVSSNFIDYSFDKNLIHAKERAKYLFVERFKGLIDNGVTVDVYAKRFADYSERMRKIQNVKH